MTVANGGIAGEVSRNGASQVRDFASKLRDEHFADELHPNDEGAEVIATAVFRVLSEVRDR